MRKYILTFASDDIRNIEIIYALHDAGMRNFKVKEVEDLTYENWKKDVDEDCAENAQTQSCDCCKYISCHLNQRAIYCKLYGGKDDSKACKSFVPDSEI